MGDLKTMSTDEQREPPVRGRRGDFFFNLYKKKFKIYLIVVSQRLGDDDAAGRWEGLPEIISQEINHRPCILKDISLIATVHLKIASLQMCAVKSEQQISSGRCDIIHTGQRPKKR